MCIYSSNAYTRLFFFFNDTATTEIYTLSLHDALPIFLPDRYLFLEDFEMADVQWESLRIPVDMAFFFYRSEEHTSELQSRQYLVCRLLLEKKKLKCTLLPYNTTRITTHFFCSHM